MALWMGRGRPNADQRGVDADDAMAEPGQHPTESALTAANIHRKTTSGWNQAQELGQVEGPED
jgi:hypothetical protein